MMNSKLSRLLQLASTYLPLIATIAVLLVSTFDAALLDKVPLSSLLALMALSFIFIAVHLVQRLGEAESSTQSLGKTVAQLETGISDRLTALETTHKDYLNATAPVIRIGSLAEAFSHALGGRQRIGHLRVYAISSQEVYSFISNSTLTIDRCSLLIQAPPDATSDFAVQVRLNATNWRKLAEGRDRRISKLEIRSYDYFPTDYEVLIDSDALILGLFDYDPDDYSHVRLRASTVFEATSPAAERLIAEFSDRFDGLFDACLSAHGANRYEGI
jgi:hypothetical protein